MPKGVEGSPAETPSEEEQTVERLVLGFLGLVGIILILLKPWVQNQLLQSFLPGLGDALIIAAVIAFFFELRGRAWIRRDLAAELRAVRQELTKERAEVSHDLSSRLGELAHKVSESVVEIKKTVVHDIEKFLPQRAVITLKQQILNPVFLRENFEVALELTRAGSRDIVKASLTISYNIRNLSQHTDTHLMRLYLDEVIDLGDKTPPAKLEKVKIRDRVMIGDEISSSCELTPRAKLVSSDGMLKFEWPVEVGSGEHVPVELHGYQLMHDTDLFPWSLADICTSLAVTITKPSHLDLLVLPNHPVRERMSEFTVGGSENLVMAEINEVILPYQGIELRWKPRAHVSSSQEPAGPI